MNSNELVALKIAADLLQDACDYGGDEVINVYYRHAQDDHNDYTLVFNEIAKIAQELMARVEAEE